MSETPKPPDLFNAGGPEEEQDVIFRVQMTVANFVLGFWKQGLVLLGVGLAGVFVYSLWQTHTRDDQREQQAALVRVDLKLPAPSQLAMMGMGPLDDPSDTARTAQLVEAATAFEAVAKDGSGTAGAMAWVRAAQIWERAGKKDEAKNAWENAHKASGPGPIGLAGATGLASQKAAAGDVDGAVALLRGVEGAGFEAQWALYQAGLTYEGAGRKQDAVKVFEEFRTRFASSVIADQVALALARVQEAG